MAKISNYDLIILGGGAAGLSLAMELANLGIKEKKFAIIEARAEYKNDKSWCFWLFDNFPSHIRRLIRNRWENWEISGEGKKYTLQSTKTPYCYINSLDFYDLSIQMIKQSLNIDLYMNTEIHRVEKNNELYHIHTNREIFYSKSVVDTRINLESNKPHHELSQIFWGAEIKFEYGKIDLWKKNKCYLMHNLKNITHGVSFEYILPFSERHLLFEYTQFTHENTEPASIKNHCYDLIERYFAKERFQIIREEKGNLPMRIMKTKRKEKRYVYAGISGGALRASSGYTFSTILEWANQCAENIKKKGYPTMPKQNRIYLLLDTIFLNVLKHEKISWNSLFLTIAQNLNGSQFSRFMHQKMDFTDYYSLLKGMPYSPFIKQFLKYILGIERR